jgi:heme A synthase
MAMEHVWKQTNKFAKFAWLVLAYTLLVVLWGAYVRATGAGAGCGSHWPLCNGQVIPRPERIETLIEFSHRLSSGLLGILLVGLLVWAWRAYPAGHLVRRGAVLSFVFVLIEGALGAGLVLFELVAGNESLARAVSGALHLVNTFLLVAMMTLTAWWATGGERLRWRNQGAVLPLLAVGGVLVLLLGASGAITALGDTLFPVATLAEGIRQDFAETVHFLVRLRVWHPVIAVGSSVYLIWLGGMLREKRPFFPIPQLSRLLTGLIVTQMLAGTVNVLLLAPVWMQLVHLLLADSLWVVFVLLAATALAAEPVGWPVAVPLTQAGD